MILQSVRLLKIPKLLQSKHLRYFIFRLFRNSRQFSYTQINTVSPSPEYYSQYNYWKFLDFNLYIVHRVSLLAISVSRITFSYFIHQNRSPKRLSISIPTRKNKFTLCLLIFYALPLSLLKCITSCPTKVFLCQYCEKKDNKNEKRIIRWLLITIFIPIGKSLLLLTTKLTNKF